MNNIYKRMLLNRESKRKMLAILLDPDQCRGRVLSSTISALKTDMPDFIFVGGSLTVSSTESLIDILREETKSVIILFPGNAAQFTPKADALLNLSLLSGRNPEFLIGQHVNSSIAIKKSGIEIIPTGYLLVDGGKPSSVEYMSNTRPIPRDKKEIALSTAVAGELLGMRMVYLEAGSGASLPVPPEMISYVRDGLSLPLIVGGGIKSTWELGNAFEAGADLVVVGNIFESHPEKIAEFVTFTHQFGREEEDDENEEENN